MTVCAKVLSVSAVLAVLAVLAAAISMGCRRGRVVVVMMVFVSLVWMATGRGTWADCGEGWGSG